MRNEHAITRLGKVILQRIMIDAHEHGLCATTSTAVGINDGRVLLELRSVVHLAGGGALIRGLAEKLTEKTGIRFICDSDPLTCVVRGVGRVIENLDQLKNVCIAA